MQTLRSVRFSNYIEKAVNIYPVAKVSTSIRHGGTTMAPTATVLPAARSAPGMASVGTGARAGVVPA